jgi:hypothetical protein
LPSVHTFLVGDIIGDIRPVSSRIYSSDRLQAVEVSIPASCHSDVLTLLLPRIGMVAAVFFLGASSKLASDKWDLVLPHPFLFSTCTTISDSPTYGSAQIAATTSASASSSTPPSPATVTNLPTPRSTLTFKSTPEAMDDSAHVLLGCRKCHGIGCNTCGGGGSSGGEP